MLDMLPALFLDRDGVIIENRANYVRSWEDVQFFPSALTALRLAATLPHRIVIVTNQSAVGRGFISLDEAEELNQQIIHVIESAGGRIDGVFMCPHVPAENCACRKPKPGLLLQAAQELSIRLKDSVMIGDALSDLLAGQAAGIQDLILVKTGRGIDQARFDRTAIQKPFRIVEDLASALTAYPELFSQFPKKDINNPGASGH